MADLRTRLDGKTILIFSAREFQIATTLFLEFGAKIIVSTEQVEALAFIRTQLVDAALLDITADPEKLFDLAELLTSREKPFLFAAHADDAPAMRFNGFYFPKDLAGLRLISETLFAAPVIH